MKNQLYTQIVKVANQYAVQFTRLVNSEDGVMTRKVEFQFFDSETEAKAATEKAHAEVI